ncbi:Uncharacterised protein [Streptococcus pneumoniae]|nr:Uncharacterised protein [Streptococcus pneumoniae]CKX26627.1 Uncharacterised protein [Mycobacterium tuberculosis]
MGSIDIGIGHQNEFLVTGFRNIKFCAKSCSHGCEKTTNFFVS